jgi:hypothetical protein
MRTLALYLAAGAAALIAVDHAGVTASLALTGSAHSGSVGAQQVERALKGDRGQIVTAKSEHQIAAVEVVGLEQASIIYRDHTGKILYRTDPVGNATVVVRGVKLPEVTVREGNGRPVRQIDLPGNTPAPASQKPENRKPEKAKVPDGCELAVSLLAESAAAQGPARCVAGLSQDHIKLAQAL